MANDSAPPPATQPAGGIEIGRDDTGVTISVPARGLLRGGRGFFIFGAVGLPAAAAIAFLVLRTGLSVEKVFYGAFAPIVLAAGAAIALRIGLRLGAQRATIRVAGDTLHVRTVTALWPRRRQWPRDRLASVAVGEVDYGGRGGEHGSNYEWSIRYKRLEITDTRGRKFALLVGWSEDELDRVARAVTEGLRAKKASPPAV